MPKSLIKVVSFLLITGLLADPATAAGDLSGIRGNQPLIDGVWFNQQALTERGLPHPRFWRNALHASNVPAGVFKSLRSGSTIIEDQFGNPITYQIGGRQEWDKWNPENVKRDNA